MWEEKLPFEWTADNDPIPDGYRASGMGYPVITSHSWDLLVGEGDEDGGDEDGGKPTDVIASAFMMETQFEDLMLESIQSILGEKLPCDRRGVGRVLGRMTILS